MADSFDKAFDSMFDDTFDKVYDKVNTPRRKRSFSEAFMESQDAPQMVGAAITTMNEEPTPFLADQYNTLGRKGFVDRYVRPVTEGGGLTVGSMLGLAGGGWAGEPYGGGIGYDIASQATDQLAGERDWSMYRPNDRNIEVGATMAMGGPLVGKYLSPAIEGVKNTYTGTKNWLAKKMPWTEEAVQSKVGNTLADNMGASPQYALNNMATTELEGTIPGYKASLGERTADPGLIKLQRSNERRPGPYADAKAQNIADNQAAMRDYLNTEFTGSETIDDVIEALSRRKSSLESQTKSAANKVDEVKGSLNVKEPQETGRAITSEIEAQRFPAKQEVKAKYDAIPNEPIPPSNTSKVIEDLEKNFRPGDEDVYPKRAIDRVKEALKGKHPENQEPGPDMIIGYAKDGRPVLQKETTDLQVRAFKGEQVENPIVSEKPIPGFQDLHSLRKDLGRQIKSAKFSGNDELAMKLQQLKNGVDADIEASMVGKDTYDEARKAYIDYAQRFKTGAIADIRQPGKEITGLNMPSASIGKKIFTPDGADDFIRAVGKDKAGLIAEGHAAQDLISSNVVNKSTGDINAKALDNWVAKNKTVLDKYGLTADYENIQAAQHSLDAAKGQMAKFDKSAAAKVLGSDPQKAIAAAFQGADKKTGQVMFDLVKKVGDNPEALRGLQNAFKDFIIDKAETTASNIASDRILSPASIVKDMKKYEEAMKVLYAKDPEKLAALVNVQKAIETSARSLKSPLGGGSDTLENAASGFGSHVIGSIMAKLPGGDFAVKLGRIGLGALNKLGQKELDSLMVRAMYDPELAQTLISAARGTATKEAITVQMDRHLTQAGLGGFGVIRASNDEEDIRRSLQQNATITKGLETVANAIANPKNLGYKDHIAMMEDQIKDRKSALNQAAEWVVYNLSPPGMMYSGAKAITDRGVPKSVMQVAETINDLFNMMPPGMAETALAKFAAGGALAQIAYHGSPKGGIKNFSKDFIGTGEGAQAFGHGLYFTNREEIANFYRDKLSGNGRFVMDNLSKPEEALLAKINKVVDDNPNIMERWKSINDVIGSYKEWIESRKPSRFDKLLSESNRQSNLKEGKEYQEIVDFLESKKDGVRIDKGQTYKVDIPEDTDLLHWDKPLSEQPEKVKNIINEFLKDPRLDEGFKKYLSENDVDGNQFYNIVSKTIGKGLSIDERAKAASAYLQSLGIPGHKYPAGSIAGTGKPKIDWGGPKPSKEIKDMVNRGFEGVMDNGKSPQTADDALTMLKKYQEEWLGRQKLGSKYFGGPESEGGRDLREIKETIDFLEQNKDKIKVDHPYNFVIYDDSAIKIMNGESKELARMLDLDSNEFLQAHSKDIQKLLKDNFPDLLTRTERSIHTPSLDPSPLERSLVFGQKETPIKPNTFERQIKGMTDEDRQIIKDIFQHHEHNQYTTYTLQDMFRSRIKSYKKDIENPESALQQINDIVSGLTGSPKSADMNDIAEFIKKAKGNLNKDLKKIQVMMKYNIKEVKAKPAFEQMTGQDLHDYLYFSRRNTSKDTESEAKLWVDKKLKDLGLRIK